MSARSVYTPRAPAAGGDNSTPAPVQDYVLSSTPVPPTAAKAGDLTIFDLATSSIGRFRQDVKRQMQGDVRGVSLPCGPDTRPSPARGVALRSRCISVTGLRHCVAVATHLRHRLEALRCGRDARLSPPCRVAWRSRVTFSTSLQRCRAAVSHDLHQLAALRRGRDAVRQESAALPRGRDGSASKERSVGSRRGRSCLKRAQRCLQDGTVVHQRSAALPRRREGLASKERSVASRTGR